jgi:addiction module HigA family antidote
MANGRGFCHSRVMFARGDDPDWLPLLVAVAIVAELRGIDTDTASAGHSHEKPGPSGFVKTEIIEPLGLSVIAAAQVLGITRAALNFLNERASLSPDMAIRIEKACGCRTASTSPRPTGGRGIFALSVMCQTPKSTHNPN